MKWIGQHIYDLVSRFRNDVYLEDIDTGTIASGGNLGLDSNNKIVKATVSSGSGDMTGVDLTGTLPIVISSEANTTSGDYSSTIGINTGNGILIDGGGDLVTNDSEIDHDSLDNFVAAEHVDWAGASAGTIHSSNVPTLNQNTSGTAASLSATLPINRGGTGAVTAQASMNALAGGVNAGRYLRGNGSDVVLSAIQTSDIGTLNQNTTGSAGTVTSIGNLTGDVTSSNRATTIADDAVTFSKAQGVTPNVFDNTIKLLPSDFMSNEEGGATKNIQFVDNNASGIKRGSADGELLAFVSIPQGMSIDKVDVYAGGTFAVDVIEMNVNASNGDLSGSSIGTGNCNTQVECTNTASTATNYFMIQVDTTSTGHRVYGGIVTIV
jgi:hypothetical protein